MLGKRMFGNHDDDDGKTWWTVRLGMGIFVLMCLSLFKSCNEFRYSTSGRTFQTKVDKVEEETGRYGRVVGYSLLCKVNDPETKTNMIARVPVAEADLADYLPGTPVELQYIGNEPANFKARLNGMHDYLWVGLFFTFLALLIGGFVWGCIHWNRAQAADKRGRRR